MSPERALEHWRRVEEHLPQVRRLARNFRALRVPTEDLVAEGVLGLFEAASRFDPEHGVKFSTYASWWVLKRMRESLAAHASIVRLHRFLQGIFLGAGVDLEPDGQPNTSATGDDLFPAGVPDDEDGVTFLSPLNIGQTASIQVVAFISGRLDAWVDFNIDGDWADPGEQIYASFVLSAGPNTITFPVPASAQRGTSFARFRFSREGGLAFTGLAGDGEVEDYQVDLVQNLDFGDAPDSYQTLLASDGARHRGLQGFYLGARLTAHGSYSWPTTQRTTTTPLPARRCPRVRRCR